MNTEKVTNYMNFLILRRNSLYRQKGQMFSTFTIAFFPCNSRIIIICPNRP